MPTATRSGCRLAGDPDRNARKPRRAAKLKKLSANKPKSKRRRKLLKTLSQPAVIAAVKAKDATLRLAKPILKLQQALPVDVAKVAEMIVTTVIAATKAVDAEDAEATRNAGAVS